MQNWSRLKLQSESLYEHYNTEWLVFIEVYLEKLQVKMYIGELKKLIEPVISSVAGYKCSRAIFLSEN